MTIDIKRVTQIRKDMNRVPIIIDIPAYPTDRDRQSYLFTELDSLTSIISLVNENYFKESLIILRTVFEKFLFFWLMFKGTKYKWTDSYRIEPKTSRTPREARDKTFQLWQELKHSGDPKYATWEIQKGHEENVILLTFEEEGYHLTRNGRETDEIVPVYNNMLTEYEPDIKHLSDIENTVNNLIDHENADNVTFYQDKIYNHYFYIANIFRNLRINNLVDKFQLNTIRIHYNFLSKYVHPSKFSIELWDDMNHSYGTKSIKEQAWKELILFYCIKLMQLYFGIFISGYQNTKSIEDYSRFQTMVNELDEMSKDFWFFDNEPTRFDLDYSESIKKSRIAMQKTVPDGLIYNENPLDRLIRLRDYRP